ncbi:hypothetical protein NQZ68_008444 [Dissostichus eleginoides]|nr:hypothetical protein NQZ68_008444 [Dissostichus eleginoides]
MVPNSPVHNSGSWHSGWTSDTSRLVLAILKETVMQKEQLLPALQPGDTVYTKLDNEKSWKTPAIASTECVTPRSYLINTQGGAVLRRNQLHLRAEPTSRPAQHIPLTPAESAVAISQPVSANTPETVTLKPSEVTTHTPTPGRVQTRSGRVSKPATRLDL